MQSAKKTILDINSNEIQKTVSEFANVIRAEKNNPASYLNIYADSAVIHRISNVNNQIIYGRRGTGKTHLFFALMESLANDNKVSDAKSIPVYIDLRKVLPLLTQQNGDSIETAVLIFKHVIEQIIFGICDNLDAIYEIEEFGRKCEIETTKENELKNVLKDLNFIFDGTKFKKLGQIDFTKEEIAKISANLSLSSNPGMNASGNIERKDQFNDSYIKYISFSQITEHLDKITKLINNSKIYCLIDEWSELPIKLQPFVAELLKRSFIASNYVLKISAIPYRSKFRDSFENENKIGLEEGGDVFPFSLDNRYVFELDKIGTRSFYNELLFKHLTELNPQIIEIMSPRRLDSLKQNFINTFFANQALSEILVASAGIPRDFINLFINSYNNRTNKKQRIVLKNVRNATTEWYTLDKKEEVEKDKPIKILFEAIVNAIIIEKRKTHFLLPQNLSENKYIKKLIDLRVLHIREKGISHKHIPNKLYDVFSIDYGSYTSLDIAKRTLDTDFTQLAEDLHTIEDVREARSLSLEEDFFDRYFMEIGEGIICPNCKKIIDINHLAFTKQNCCNHCYEKIS